MKDLIKYSGVIVILLGVLCLAIPAFIKDLSDTILFVGGFLMVVGLLVFIITNRIIKD